MLIKCICFSSVRSTRTEITLAKVVLSIVFIFIVCHIPRIYLAFYRVSTVVFYFVTSIELSKILLSKSIKNLLNLDLTWHKWQNGLKIVLFNSFLLCIQCLLLQIFVFTKVWKSRLSFVVLLPVQFFLNHCIQKCLRLLKSLEKLSLIKRNRFKWH